ncbi:MAG: hypothetical protein M1831_001533 [Alyxoria varia]|nr:MAG: hypothetical protein M1831_001533 [Alyxoria varia]
MFTTKAPSHVFIGTFTLLFSFLITSTAFAKQVMYWNDGTLDMYPSWVGREPPTNHTVHDILIRNCDDKQLAALDRGLTDQASAAAYLRDVLSNPTGKNETTASMLDFAFGFNLKFANGSDNIQFAHDVFDNMARGVTVNPENHEEEAPSRYACVGGYWASKFATLQGTTDPRRAFAVLTSKLFAQADAKTFKTCWSKQMNKFIYVATALASVNAHLAGCAVWDITSSAQVGLSPPSGASVHNANTFGWAVMLHLSGCTEQVFKTRDATPQKPNVTTIWDDGTPASDGAPVSPPPDTPPHNGELRKLLTTDGTFPSGEGANTTDFTNVTEDARPSTEEATGGDLEDLYDTINVKSV